MWILQLNDMRSSQVQILTDVFRAETEQQLHQMVESETVEYYYDGQWGKQFRKDGPLEWFNPMGGFGRMIDVGTEDDWVVNARNEYQSQVMSLQECPVLV